MQHLINYIDEGPALIAWLVLAAAFFVLAKCADMFVESSVAVADRFHVPKIVIGIVLVSLATTAPELSVSLMAAISGRPEIALGNAVGSVICNCGLALALCAIVSAAPIPVLPSVLKTAGTFLLGVSALSFAFVVGDRTLSRWEGGLLVLLGVGYIGFLLDQRRRGNLKETVDLADLEDDVVFPVYKLIGLFIVGLGGILISSKFVIVSAVVIARLFRIPESAIALTLVAFGTSVPEVATSITAARKGQGELAVGNVLGANIMNICFVAGVSAFVNNLTLGARSINFMFPAMFVTLGATLIALKTRSLLSRKEGVLLLGLYAVYIACFLFVFRSG